MRLLLGRSGASAAERHCLWRVIETIHTAKTCRMPCGVGRDYDAQRQDDEGEKGGCRTAKHGKPFIVCMQSVS